MTVLTSGTYSGLLQGRALRFNQRTIVHRIALLATLLMAVLASQGSNAAPAAPQTVTLAWNASPDSRVVGYNIYFGTASRAYTGLVPAGSSTTGSVQGLATGVTYYFAVTAYDSSGLESAFSNEVSYTPGVTSPGTVLTLSVGAASAPALTVSGTPGRTVEILASENLVDWSVIDQVTVGSSGSVQFTDTSAAGKPQRFYRTRQL